VRDAALLVAFDGVVPGRAGVPLTIEFNLTQCQLTIATDPKQQIILSGGQVTASPLWKRLVQEFK
jgi:hypothetical protein